MKNNNQQKKWVLLCVAGKLNFEVISNIQIQKKGKRIPDSLIPKNDVIKDLVF